MTYYVDCQAASDRGAGTSIDTAWKTIARVNAASLSPGDVVLLRRGGMWRETLTPPTSGSEGDPITFGAYGSGDKPIINGADPVSGWTAGTAQDQGGDRMWDDFENGGYLNAPQKWSHQILDSDNTLSYTSAVAYAGRYSLHAHVGNTGISSAALFAANLGDVLPRGAGVQAVQDDFWVAFRFRYHVSGPYDNATAQHHNTIFSIQPIGFNAFGWTNPRPISLHMNPDGRLSYSADKSKQVDAGCTIPPDVWVRIKVHIWSPNAATDASTIAILIDEVPKVTARFTGNYTNYERVDLGPQNVCGKTGTNADFYYDNFSMATFEPRTVVPYSAATGWHAPIADAMTAMVDGIPLFMVNGLGGLHRGAFYFDDASGTAYVVLPSGDSPDLHATEIGRRRYNIDAYQKHYLTFQDLDLRNACETNIYENESTHWVLSAIEMTNAQRRGLTLDDPGTLIDYYTCLRDSKISYISWGNILGMAAGIYGDYVGELSFTRNSFDHIGEHGIRIDNPGANIVISDSTFHDLGSSAADGPPDGANSVVFENCEVYNASLYDIKAGVGAIGVVRYNRIHDCWGYGGMKISSDDDAEIYYNEFYHNHGFDIAESNVTTGVKVYNNTLGSLMGDEAGGTAACSIAVALRKSTGWIIKNNIGRYLRFAANAPTVDYNDWYRPGLVDVVNADGTPYGKTTAFAAWIAGGHPHDLNADPAYADLSLHDFRLRPASAARNSGTPLGLKRDVLGTEVPTSTPDMGAHQHVECQQ